MPKQDINLRGKIVNILMLLMSFSVSLQSMSYTDWLNSVVTSDSLGDVILAILPHISSTPQHVKRTIERRFVSLLFFLFI